MENKLAHAEALPGRDSTNTNLPTGQTLPEKKRYIPNSRRNTGKGGQPGHEKSTLKKLSPDEITDEIEHPVTEEECQYGPMVQATALSLMNTTNAAINKTALLLSGMTGGGVCPSGGYIAKLMKRGSGKLDLFMSDLFQALIARPLVYWDDTVVMADKKRICLRFYGDENIAYRGISKKPRTKPAMPDRRN